MGTPIDEGQEPLVLLHGLAGTIRQWDPLVDTLGSRYRVIVPDLAGHLEGPELPPGEFSIVRTPADAVERELDALGVRSAHFVGSSLGGAVAFELAARGRARSVIALAPAGAIDTGAEERRRVQKFFRDGRRAISLLGPAAGPAMKLRGARWLFFRQSVARPTELDPAAAAYALRAFAAPPDALIDGSPRKRWWSTSTACAAPSCSSGASATASSPSNPGDDRSRRRCRMPNSESSRASHLPMIDDPALVAGAVVAFTERNAGPT